MMSLNAWAPHLDISHPPVFRFNSPQREVTVQINIHPKAKRILIILTVFAIIGIGWLAILPQLFPAPVEQQEEIAADTDTVISAISAFYTLDYTESSELWAARVCTYATEAGCQAIRNFHAPIVHASVQKYQVQTGCAVEPLEVIEQAGTLHTWRVRVTLEHPWSALESPTLDVLVEMQQVGGRWLLNRILFEQEEARFPQSTP